MIPVREEREMVSKKKESVPGLSLRNQCFYIL